MIYPYLKRFTWLCHLWLGAVDGARAGRRLGRGDGRAAAGRRGRSAPPSRCWVAGFDLFYSLFDVEIDRAQGLHSWAVRFGERGVVLRRARRCTSLTVAAASSRSGSASRSASWYWLGVLAVAVLLVYEHSLVRPGDLRRLDAAFFT